MSFDYPASPRRRLSRSTRWMNTVTTVMITIGLWQVPIMTVMTDYSDPYALIKHRELLGWLGGRAAFEAALGGKVDIHVGLGNVGQACIGVGRSDLASRELVQVHLQNGDESLQIGLLIGGEGQIPALDQGHRRRPPVIAPAVHTLPPPPLLLENLPP